MSFVDLYNRILPPTKTDYLQAICTKSAFPSFQENCLVILHGRLKYLNNLRDLKAAMFTRQPPVQINKSPLKLKISWQEDLSFFNGTTQINHQAMTLTLKKNGYDWKIVGIEQIEGQ